MSDKTENIPDFEKALAELEALVEKLELQIAALKKQEDLIDRELSEYAQLVTPRQMPGLLKEFFEKSNTLKLIGLTKHEVKPAFKKIKVAVNNEQNKNADQTNTAERNIEFYRHDFTVNLRGKYFDLAKSLEALEAMNIKIYWDSLEYTVDGYPYADIKLTVYTFSYDKKWIGA